jgi:hypothetical protein
LGERERESAQLPAPGRVDTSEVDTGGFRRGPVPALAVRHGLPSLQGRGVPELGAVAHRRVDVEHGVLAHDNT